MEKLYDNRVFGQQCHILTGGTTTFYIVVLHCMFLKWEMVSYFATIFQTTPFLVFTFCFYYFETIFYLRNYHFLHCGTSLHVFEIRNDVCTIILWQFLRQFSLLYLHCVLTFSLSFSLYCFFYMFVKISFLFWNL